MKSPARIAAWMLPLFLTACFHRTHPSQLRPYAPPLSIVPKPEVEAVELPPSAATIATQPLTADTVPQPQPAPKPPSRRRRSTSKNTQQAANAAPLPPAESPEVSAIGQLSSGDPPDLRRQTADLIAATEHGLTVINRSLNSQEQKTAGQIKEDLKQAKEALASGDVDGAHTLAAKAKVLLNELAGS